ncbi:hypothetical protein SNE40_002983 [Patella caerulea]|uniref:Uncharacterized protein n=1 Tax=Patella caerulea TaxID=87958 RepID=A0AAN8K9M3_PATCE
MASKSETGVKGVSKDSQATEEENITSGTTDRSDVTVKSKTQPTSSKAPSQASKVQSSPGELEPHRARESRKRTMTGKGQAYTLEKCKKTRDNLAVSLTVKLRKINALMEGDPDLSIMRRKYTEWMEIFENFLLAQDAYEKLLPSIEVDDEGETQCLQNLKGK